MKNIRDGIFSTVQHWEQWKWLFGRDCQSCEHDDVIKWKHFPCYRPFVRGNHRSAVNSLHKGQWRGALMFSLICAWIKVARACIKSCATYSINERRDQSGNATYDLWKDTTAVTKLQKHHLYEFFIVLNINQLRHEVIPGAICFKLTRLCTWNIISFIEIFVVHFAISTRNSLHFCMFY